MTNYIITIPTGNPDTRAYIAWTMMNGKFDWHYTPIEDSATRSTTMTESALAALAAGVYCFCSIQPVKI